jgi:hypothetical protein
MADYAASESGHVGVPHRILDRLTAMKLRVGSLRRRVRLGAIAPEEIEIHLAQIDVEIDATAALAQDVQGKEARLA